MSISFLVPMFNEERNVSNAIDSILSQKTGYEIEIVVVDDGSTDGSAKIVESRPEACIRLIRKSNGGEASALNVGLEHCTGDFIALVEADVELEADWLRLTLDAFDEDRVIGVGGYLVTPPEDSWIARIAGYEVESKFSMKERATTHITSANAIFRREAFDAAGGFNEKLVNASLDSDFNSRLVRQGHSLIYVNGARARHHYKPTFFEYLKRQYAYARYRVHAGRDILYSADVFLAFNVVLAGLLSVSLATIPVVPWLSAAIFGLAILLQFPAALRLLIQKRDPVAFLYPPVIVLRNVVAAGGYAVGLARKSVGKY